METSDRYVYRSRLAQLKSLKLYDLKEWPLNMASSIVMNSLKFLEVRNSKRKKQEKPLSLIGLNLLELRTLRIVNYGLSRFSNNDLPSLTQLEIEELAKAEENYALELNHNKLSELKDLSINAPFVREIYGNKLPCNNDTLANKENHSMVRFRLDTSLEKLARHALGDIRELLSIATSLAIVVRDDPTVARKVLRNTYNTSRVRKLTLIDQTLITMDWLSEIDFPNLRKLHLYNTNKLLISLPSLKMAKITELSIIESRINTINISANPVLKRIIFLDNNRAIPTRYFHFAARLGSSPSLYKTGHVEKEVRFTTRTQENVGKHRAVIRRRTRELGLINLDRCEKGY